MVDISRRALITTVGVGAGVVALGGAGIWWTQQNQNGSQSGNLGVQPQTLVSTNGALTVDLVAAYSDVVIGGKKARLKTYNGTTPGPTLIVSPGDVITVNFTNNLGEPTNLHMHGLNVSPVGKSDNVFLEIADGQTFTYEYRLDTSHPSGPFWYHPHHHGMAADQLFAGLYGAVIVQDVDPIHAVNERVFVLSDITLDGNGAPAAATMMSKMMGREGEILLVNGQMVSGSSIPSYSAQTRSRERWRIYNASASRYMQLDVKNASAHMLGKDSGRYSPTKPLNAEVIAPGNRLDMLVDLGNEAAVLSYTTVAHPDSMGMMGNSTTYKDFALARIVPRGNRTIGLPNLPLLNPGVDLRKVGVSAKRTFTLAMPTMGGGMGMGNMNGGFTINGAAFDHHTVNTTTALDSIEEWTIVNTSTMAHPFHLHVWPMQMVSVGSDAITGVEYQDVVNVPAKSKTVVRVHFSKFSGKAVYHCHILDHEDQGMMAVIEVK